MAAWFMTAVSYDWNCGVNFSGRSRTNCTTESRDFQKNNITKSPPKTSSAQVIFPWIRNLRQLKNILYIWQITAILFSPVPSFFLTNKKEAKGIRVAQLTSNFRLQILFAVPNSFICTVHIPLVSATFPSNPDPCSAYPKGAAETNKPIKQASIQFQGIQMVNK